MNSKIKKIMLLTTGLAGGLLATSIAGITLSSCTFQVQQDPNNNNNDNNNNQGNSGSTNQGTTTSPKDELTYNPNANYYTTQIIFDKDGNITNASANTLTIKGGLIFADPAMTTLIGIMPSMQQSTITIPASVKAITGYQAAVVYNTASGNIVNPSFSPTSGITVGNGNSLLDLGAVGAFQHVGTITNGTDANTPPKMAPATGLSTLTKIEFENNSQLQTIGPKAFAGCNNLTTVNLPNSTNTIGALAFQNCTNLQTINLKGVSYIGDAAFNNAFIAQNDALATQNPVVLDLTSAQYIGTGAFDSSKWTSTPSAGTGTQTPVQVLPGTTSSGSQTTITEVQNLSKISAVSFAKPLTTLSPYAFNGANYLASVDLSNCTSLASVSNNAFSGTQNLTSVKFSNTIDTIGNNAFSGVNAKLTSLTLPANLAMVGDNAFNGCSQLSTLTVDSTSLSIGTSAFSGCNLSALDFSKAVGGLIIGTSAFSNNKNLKTLKLATENLEPDSQTQIKSQAFSGCTNLDLQPVTQGPDGTPAPTTTPIALPSNLTLLAQDAFSGTKNPTFSTTYTGSVQLDSNEWIANDPFGGRWNINQDGSVNENSSNNTETLGPQLFANNQSITSVDLTGSNIKALGWTSTSSISDVIGSQFTIPGGANTSSTLGTFANCTSLTNLTLPATCNQFGTSKDNYYWGSPFANCQSLANIKYNGFDLTPVSDGENAVTAGFAQMNQDTWRQVANIMNAFGYAGQQTIGANGDVTDNPSAADGTWASLHGLNNKGSSIGGVKCWQSGMNGLFATTTSDNSWINQPINAYGAGSYSYQTATAPGGGGARATTNPVEVPYAPGLGYSTAATTGVGGANGIGTLEQVDQNGYLTIQSNPNLNDNTTIQVLPSTGAEATDTITISGTRPMSVWYTVGTSAPANPANNIYVPTANKLVGQVANSGSNNNDSHGTNNGDGGIGWTSTAFVQNVKKIDGTNTDSAGTPFKLEGMTNDSGATGRSFYALPLGITAETTVAYFNHNGVIWKYENKDGSITITGTVNYYVAGSIQDQKNRILPDTLSNQTSNNSGNGLTSVGAIANGSDQGGPSNQGFYGLNGTSKYSYNGATAGILLFSQNGKTTTGEDAQISTSVGPKGLKVTLTLVPASTNNSGSQN